MVVLPLYPADYCVNLSRARQVHLLNRSTDDYFCDAALASNAEARERIDFTSVVPTRRPA